MSELQRPAEAVVWYRKATELGHPFGASRLYQVCQKSPQSTLALPGDLRVLLDRAAGAATKDETPPDAFARLVKESQDNQGREAAAKREREARELAQASGLRRVMQTAQLQTLAAQFRDLADSNLGKDAQKLAEKPS